MPEIICATCGKLLIVKPCRLKTGNAIYCSRECYHISLRKERIERTCLCCGKKYSTYPSKSSLYCSRKCYVEHAKTHFIESGRTKKIECNCLYCGKKFSVLKSAIEKWGAGKYCSRECWGKAQKGTTRISKKVSRICLICGKEFFIKPKTVKAGGGKYCSKECRIIGSRGENYNIENTDRKSGEYIEWRMAVYKRDNYTCKKCQQKGGKLNAHHIIPFSVDKSLRFDISNGITLCTKCHKKEHLKLSQKKNKQMDIFEIRKENRRYENTNSETQAISICGN